MEPLAQSSKGDKRLSRETAGGHLTVGGLVLLRTLAGETAREPVHTLPTVLTHTRYALARGRIQLTMLTYKTK